MAPQWVPPGHFYSPIPSLNEVGADAARIFEDVSPLVEAIDLRESDQLKLLADLAGFYDEMPFQSNRVTEHRYYFDNVSYTYSDAILLYSMIRFLRPESIVEVGSGFSSCVMLDTNDLFFGGSIDITFIDPHPELLASLLRPEDRERTKTIASRVQDVNLTEFERLAPNDILFVDSTHISKVGSDVNHLLFRVLPRLSAGVYVHFHDVFFPFEYPKEWIYEGRAWNEAYFLRSFLQYNTAFEVVLMNTFMEHFHEQVFRETMPLCLKDPGGSLWIRKR